MSSADEAFDNLLGKNALNIPIANPSAEAEHRIRQGRPMMDGIAMANPNASASGDMSEAMRVLSMLDDPANDYNPRGYNPEDGEGVFATPTETDLEAVDAEDPAETRVARRDVVEREMLSATDTQLDTDIDTVIDAIEVSEEDESVDAAGDADLRRARRVRRFAYLPLAEMEHFENRARDIMASLASQDPDRPSLAITSPARGDGQTEIAIRLALAMAKRVDYRIVLVDFDIRKPQVAQRLGLSSKYFTLADVLRGSCNLGEALMFSEEDNLYVLPARANDREGDEVLSDRQVQAVLAQIHATFDFAVLGCGPADNADAGIVCRHAGTTALAGFCNKTPAKSLRLAAENLEESGARVAGLLLTGY